MNTSSLWLLATLLIPVLFPIAVALAALLYTRCVQHLPMQQRLIVSSMAHTVVTAVEQMAQEDTPGGQKKDLALHALTAILSGIGIKVPAPLLEMAIEAAVFELHILTPHTSNEDEESFPWRPTLRNLSVVQPPTKPV